MELMERREIACKEDGNYENEMTREEADEEGKTNSSEEANK